MSKSHTHTAPTSEACTFRRSPYFLTATYCFNQQPIAEHNVQVTHTHTHTHTHTAPTSEACHQGSPHRPCGFSRTPSACAQVTDQWVTLLHILCAHTSAPAKCIEGHLRLRKSQISELHFYRFCVHIHLPLQNLSKAICVCAIHRSVGYNFSYSLLLILCACIFAPAKFLRRHLHVHTRMPFAHTVLHTLCKITPPPHHHHHTHTHTHTALQVHSDAAGSAFVCTCTHLPSYT